MCTAVLRHAGDPKYARQHPTVTNVAGWRRRKEGEETAVGGDRYVNQTF